MVKEGFITNLKGYKLPKNAGLSLDEFQALLSECSVEYTDEQAEGIFTLANLIYALGYRRGAKHGWKAAKV